MSVLGRAAWMSGGGAHAAVYQPQRLLHKNEQAQPHPGINKNSNQYPKQK